MSNYNFVDGHVKAMRPSATYTPTCMWLFDDNSQACPTQISGVAVMPNSQQSSSYAKPCQF